MRWVLRPEIDVELTRRGVERFGKLTHRHVDDGRNLLNAVSRQIPPLFRPLADGIRLRTLGRFQNEARDLAEIHGTGWRDVMLANVSYDLAIASLGCSTVVLPTPQGPVVARNMDWFPEDLLARASVLLRCHRNGELRFTHAGFPASIGVVTGLSERGFAAIINAVCSPEGLCKTGYPVLLFLRRVMEEARDFKHAVEMVSTQKLAMSALITLAGTENEERVIVERSPTKAALRWGKPGGALFATNHYRSLYTPVPLKDDEGCSRYERICELTAGLNGAGEPSDDMLLTGLSDSNVIQQITAQQILIRPRQREMKLFVPKHLLAA